MPDWKLELLGGIRLLDHTGAAQPFRTRSAALLLAYLALHPDRAHARGELSDRCWPVTDRAPRQSLSMALSSFRSLLGADFDTLFHTTRDTVLLRSEALPCDATEFQQALQAAGPAREAGLQRALSLYQGALAEGYQKSETSNDEPQTDSPYKWLLKKRQDFCTLQQSAIAELSVRNAERGDHPAALGYFLSIQHPELVAAPWREALKSFALRAETLPARHDPAPGLQILEVVARELAALTERQRRFLAALTVFPHSFSREQADQVTRFLQAADLLDELQRRQLVVPEGAGPERLALTRPVREAAAAWLTGLERARMERRLADWFVLHMSEHHRLATQFPDDIARRDVWYARMAVEGENLRGVLQRELERGDRAGLCRAYKIATHAHNFWVRADAKDERHRWVWRVFERIDQLPTHYRGILALHLVASACHESEPAFLTHLDTIARSFRADRRLGHWLMLLGAKAHYVEDDDRALRLFAEGVRYGAPQRPGERGEFAMHLCVYADALQVQGESARAHAYRQEAFTLASGGPREAEVAGSLADSLLFLGQCEAAERHAQVCIEHAFSQQDVHLQEGALRRIAQVYLTRGQRPPARQALRHALLLCQSHDLQPSAADAMRGLGQSALHQGDTAEARDWFEKGLAIWRAVGHRRWQAVLCLLLAETALCEAAPGDARTWIDAAEGHLRDTRSPALEGHLVFVRGCLALQSGDPESAVALHRDALERRVRFSARKHQLESQEELSRALAATGARAEAAALLLAATDARQTLGIPVAPARRARLQALQADLPLQKVPLPCLR